MPMKSEGTNGPDHLSVLKEDTPVHVRRKKRSRWKFITALLIASAASWTVMLKFGKPITINVTKLQEAFLIGDSSPAPVHYTPQQPASSSWPATEATPEQPSAQLPRAPTAEELNTQGKQVVFNDQNYVPRGVVNVIPPPPTQQIAYAPAQERQRPRVVRTRYENRFRWEISKGKWRGGTFEWIEENGSIDWNTVCQNLKPGSFEYRDCRKGAKVRFKEICGNYSPACRAEDSFMP